MVHFIILNLNEVNFLIGAFKKIFGSIDSYYAFLNATFCLFLRCLYFWIMGIWGYFPIKLYCIHS
jgi:hypothetical protein